MAKTSTKTKNTGNAGKGRPKGSQNKINTELKEMILTALEKAHDDGGVAYLTSQARANPKAFMSLLGRVLPMTVQGAGEDGELTISVTRKIIHEPAARN